MLREITVGVKTDGGMMRRWFNDERMDLFVWFDGDVINRFQLAYDKLHAEKSIDWKRGRGFMHSRVDAGAGDGGYPVTPLMAQGGRFPKKRVVREFEICSVDIDFAVRVFVLRALAAYRESNCRLVKTLMATGALAIGALIAWKLWR